MIRIVVVTVTFSTVIDGFFAIIEPKHLQDCIKSFGTMIEATEVNKTSTVDSIAKIAKDANVDEFVKLRPVQIAFLSGDKQMELYACFAFDTTSSEASRKSLNLVELIESAHQYGKTFPCDDECLFDKEHKSLACSNSMKLSQVKVRQFTRDYSVNSFKCLIKHMNTSLNRNLLSYKGIKYFYFIRTIGTKNRYISSNASGIHKLLCEMLSCLNINMFNSPNGPRAFVDISLKFVPEPDSGTVTVSYLFIRICLLIIF